MPDLKKPPSVSSSERTYGSSNGSEPLKLAPQVEAAPVNGAVRPEPAPAPAGTPARGRSLRMQIRFWRTLVFALWVFARVLFSRFVMQRLIGAERVERGNKRRWIIYAREFRGFAIEMGGVMIKLGQFISTRVDALPDEITSELAGLQDEVPSVPHDEIMAVIAHELGPVGTRFEWIADQPIAAASLGQVYRARLLTGERVVVKVQRPGIREIVYTDLAALRVVARVARRFQFIRRRADTVALAKEFGRVLLEEISYHHETANAQRFAVMFRDDPGVYIPTIYTEHSTDSVLTIEDVTTIKINDYTALEAAGISRRMVAQRLMDTYLKQVFEERFFHADPHPGNLFVYPLPSQNGSGHYGKAGRPFYLIFVDFGMTASLTPQVTSALINTLTAIVTRDARKLVRSYQQLGFLLPDADTERIEEAAKATFDQVWGLSMTEIKSVSYDEARNLAHEFNDLLYSMPFQVPQDFIYLGRAMGILSGMATSLDPNFNPWQELQPYAQKMIARTLGSSGSLSLNGDGLGLSVLQSLFSGNGPQTLAEVGRIFLNRAVTVPQHIESVVSKADRGELTMRVVPTPTYRKLLRRLETQERRTTRAVIFAALLISATLLYTNGDTGPAVVGAALAGLLLMSIVFGWGE